MYAHGSVPLIVRKKRPSDAPGILTKLRQIDGILFIDIPLTRFVPHPNLGVAPPTLPAKSRAVLRVTKGYYLMDPRVRQAINLLSEDLSCDFDFKVLAESVNLSPSRLRHLFKDETGLTPARYLKYLRLERARELLEGSFLRLKEVMPQVGINDESHFVRDFKKAHGLPPRLYRQHSRKSRHLDSHQGQ